MKLFLALAWLLSACAARDVHVGRSPEHTLPTLLVVNEGMVPVRIYDDFGVLIGNVFPGGDKCIVLRRESVEYLVFRKEGRSEIGPRFAPFGTAGWVVRITNSPLWVNVLSLQPGEPCQ